MPVHAQGFLKGPGVGLELAVGMRLFDPSNLGSPVGAITYLHAGQPATMDLHVGLRADVSKRWSLAVAASNTGAPISMTFTTKPLLDTAGNEFWDGRPVKEKSRRFGQFSLRADVRWAYWSERKWRADVFGGMCGLLHSNTYSLSRFASGPSSSELNTVYQLGAEYTSKIRMGGQIGLGLEFSFRGYNHLRFAVSRSFVPAPLFEAELRVAPGTPQETVLFFNQPSSNWLVSFSYTFTRGRSKPTKAVEGEDYY